MSGWGTWRGENSICAGICGGAWHSGTCQQPDLYHFDVYRIADPGEMEEIGYEDYFYGRGVCLVEWSVQIEELLPEDALRVRLEKDLEHGFDYRRIVGEGL